MPTFGPNHNFRNILTFSGKFPLQTLGGKLLVRQSSLCHASCPKPQLQPAGRREKKNKLEPLLSNPCSPPINFFPNNLKINSGGISAWTTVLRVHITRFKTQKVISSSYSISPQMSTILWFCKEKNCGFQSPKSKQFCPQCGALVSFQCLGANVTGNTSAHF